MVRGRLPLGRRRGRRGGRGRGVGLTHLPRRARYQIGTRLIDLPLRNKIRRGLSNLLRESYERRQGKGPARTLLQGEVLKADAHGVRLKIKFSPDNGEPTVHHIRSAVLELAKPHLFGRVARMLGSAPHSPDRLVPPERASILMNDNSSTDVAETKVPSLEEVKAAALMVANYVQPDEERRPSGRNPTRSCWPSAPSAPSPNRSNRVPGPRDGPVIPLTTRTTQMDQPEPTPGWPPEDPTRPGFTPWGTKLKKPSKPPSMRQVLRDRFKQDVAFVAIYLAEVLPAPTEVVAASKLLKEWSEKL
jgi:hypothetical protein